MDNSNFREQFSGLVLTLSNVWTDSQVSKFIKDTFNVETETDMTRQIKYIRETQNKPTVQDMGSDFDLTGFTPHAASIKTSDGWIKVKKDSVDTNYIQHLKNLREIFSQKATDIYKPTSRGSGIIVPAIADLHIGARVDNLMATDDFSTAILKDRLKDVAYRINDMGKKEVHLIIAGDLVESVSGLNHIGSFQEMESNGFFGEGIMLAYDVISWFLSQINNLTSIIMVSGNHDRMTPAKEHDFKGSVAYIISGMIERAMRTQVDYHHQIVSKEIDGIQYIVCHDHHKQKKDIGNFVFRYGNQNLFNVCIGGHFHTVQNKRYFTETNTLEGVVVDEAKYRACNLGPLFTGNSYQESMGFTSNASFEVFQNYNNKLDQHILSC